MKFDGDLRHNVYHALFLMIEVRLGYRFVLFESLKCTLTMAAWNKY